MDLGPGESPHDSVWTCEQLPGAVFSGDQAYNGMHAYLADGFHEQWLAHIARLRRELAADVTLFPGHGDPGGLALLDVQERYIETLVGAMRDADWSEPERARQQVIDTMVELLPTHDLRFLMELSVEALTQRILT